MSLPKNTQTVNVDGSEVILVPSGTTTIVNVDEETGIGDPYRKIYMVGIQVLVGRVKIESNWGNGAPEFTQEFRAGEEIKLHSWSSNPLVPDSDSEIKLTNETPGSSPPNAEIVIFWVGKP